MKKIVCSILVLASIVLVGCKKEIKPESIIIGYSDNSVLVDGELALTISSPTEKANLKVKWTVDDSTIATVSGSGVLKGIKVGTVEVTATSTSDTTKSDKVVFYVIDQITKDYREPVIQLLKFSKDQNVLDKYGVIKQSMIDHTGSESLNEAFYTSLNGWISETKPYLMNKDYGSDGVEGWLKDYASYIINDIDLGVSYSFSIGLIDEYKNHFRSGEEELTANGYTDIKVVEIYKQITLYTGKESDSSEYYYVAIGKKDGKFLVLDFSTQSYQFTALDIANYELKGLDTISEIEFTELPPVFSYYLEEDNSIYRYYDISTRKAYKGYSLDNGVNRTKYLLVAQRTDDYDGVYGIIRRNETVEPSSAIGTVMSEHFSSNSSDFSIVTDTSMFDQEYLESYTEEYGTPEIVKYTFPNQTKIALYYAVYKDDYYTVRLSQLVVTDPIVYIITSLYQEQYYSSCTYSQIADSDIDSKMKEQYNEYKDEFNFTEMTAYKVTYKNGFVSEVVTIYFFKDTKGNYIPMTDR